MTDVNGRSQLSQTLHCGTAPGRRLRRVQRPHQRPGHLRRLPDRLPRVHARSSTAPRPTRRSASTSTAGRPGSCGRARSASPPGSRRAPRLLPAARPGDRRLAARTRSPASPPRPPDTTSGGVLSVDSVSSPRPTGATAAGDDRPGRPRPARASSGSPARRATGSSRSTAPPYEVKGITYGPPQAAADGYMRDLQEHGRQHDPHLGRGRRAARPTLLDKAAQQGIKVIVGHWLNQGADYVNDTAYKNARQGRDRRPGQRAQEQPGRADVGRRQRGHPDHAGLRAGRRRGRGAPGGVRQVRQRGGAGDPGRRPQPPGHLDRRVHRTPGPTTRQYSPALDLLAVNSYGAIGSGQAGLDRRRLHQAVHRHRGRPGRRVGGAQRRQRRARRADRPARSGPATRRAGTPSRPTRAWRSARPSSTTDWRTTSAASGSTPPPAAGGGSGYHALRQAYTGQAAAEHPAGDHRA